MTALQTVLTAASPLELGVTLGLLGLTFALMLGLAAVTHARSLSSLDRWRQ
jgi:hypothetical protein